MKHSTKTVAEVLLQILNEEIPDYPGLKNIECVGQESYKLTIHRDELERILFK